MLGSFKKYGTVAEGKRTEDNNVSSIQVGNLSELRRTLTRFDSLSVPP